MLHVERFGFQSLPSLFDRLSSSYRRPELAFLQHTRKRRTKFYLTEAFTRTYSGSRRPPYKVDTIWDREYLLSWRTRILDPAAGSEFIHIGSPDGGIKVQAIHVDRDPCLRRNHGVDAVECQHQGPVGSVSWYQRDGRKDSLCFVLPVVRSSDHVSERPGFTIKASALTSRGKTSL